MHCNALQYLTLIKQNIKLQSSHYRNVSKDPLEQSNVILLSGYDCKTRISVNFFYQFSSEISTDIMLVKYENSTKVEASKVSLAANDRLVST